MINPCINSICKPFKTATMTEKAYFKGYTDGLASAMKGQKSLFFHPSERAITFHRDTEVSSYIEGFNLGYSTGQKEKTQH